MQAKALQKYMVLAQAFTLFLLVSLIIFELLPTTAGNDDFVVMQQANFQLARNEFIAKDVLILEYRPANQSQAISELQTVMPAFQQVQKGLLNGDITLGLPANPPDNVQAALLASQSDYNQIVTAVNHLTTQAGKPDPIQVNIVLQHERLYVTEMYQVITLLQQNAEARRNQLVIIKVAIIGGAGLMVVLKYMLFTRRVLKSMMVAEQRDKEQQEKHT